MSWYVTYSRSHRYCHLTTDFYSSDEIKGAVTAVYNYVALRLPAFKGTDKDWNRNKGCYSTQKLHKQSSLDRLHENIGRLNHKVRRDVPGDGNCFFYCVEDQLEHIGSPSARTSKLRQHLVHFLDTVGSY